MEKTFLEKWKIIGTLIIIGGFLYSCSRSSGSENATSTYHMSLKNGTNKISATQVHANLSKSSNILMIHGRWGTNSMQGVDLRILNYNGKPGTFIIDYPNNVNIGANYVLDYSSSDVNKHYYASMGTITIEEITDSSLRGKFNFKATNQAGNSLTISEGEFNSHLAREN